MPNASTKGAVFISYSHKDADWLEKLQTMMSPLIRDRTLSVWWDGKIKPSQKWREEIDNALASAKVGVLLVSPDFLASDFISDNELPYLLNAAKRHAVKLIWVLVRNCLYAKTPIADYQAAHDASKPLKSLRGARLDDALVAICNAIEEAAKEPLEPPSPAKTPFDHLPRAQAGVLFGRQAQLDDLVKRLRKRENTCVWGPAGFGKTALAAEAVLRVVGKTEKSLRKSPYPEGVVLLDLYRYKANPEQLWHLLADKFDPAVPPELPARARAERACKGRRALVAIEGAEEAQDAETLQNLLGVLDDATTVWS